MPPEHRPRTEQTPDLQLPPDAAALPAAPPARGAAGYSAGYEAGFAARVSMERRQQQVRWLFWSWLLYWGILILAKLQPAARAWWAREVARTMAPGEKIRVSISLDATTLLWLTIGPLVLTLLWLLLVRRHARR